MVATRSRAKMLIEAGSVRVNGMTVRKPAYDVNDQDVVTVEDALRYVSRGGLKLEEALKRFPVTVQGCVVLDIGASSGGFTDCLLQNGAVKIYAVDSGSGQLAESLRRDKRVVCKENYNARYMQSADFDATPVLAVMDVSFISQTLIFPALVSVLPVGGILISLIKPQFEVGRAAVGRGGIVKDEKVRQKAILRVKEQGILYGLRCMDVIPSPILGGDGNHEYLAYFIKESERV